jgi:hypothetical protein
MMSLCLKFISTSCEAREAFLEAEAEGRKPKILSTTHYYKVQAFSEGIYWL